MRILLFFSALIFIFSCTPNENPRSAPPNIIVILSDDQGYSDLSIKGNQNLNTPNIDRIGLEGAQLNRFYVSPVCSPTRAEFLTGRYHARMGVYHTSAGGERMDLDETTIAEVFRAAGYATGAFGKWHNGMQYPYHPNARGFDEFYGFCSGHWGNYFSPPLEHNGKIVQGQGYIIDDLTDRAIDFIRQKADQPFFLYIPYNTPHTPAMAPAEYWDRMKEKELIQLADSGLDEDIQHTKAALAMCENIDWNVGRILDQLAQQGIEENTIILYFSDNGPNGYRWNNGLKGRKGMIDEGGVRSPLLIRYPNKIPAGITVNTLSGAVDLLPTLVDLAQIKHNISKPLDGQSISSILVQNSDEPWPDRYLFSSWKERSSIRSQQYLYTYQDELFDIEKDPHQKYNIATQKSDVRQNMAERLARWEAEVGLHLPPEKRPFTFGHPEEEYTQLPARDAIPHGGIKRSNKFPNSSYFTHWTSTEDRLTWDVEVLETGTYEVELYYTCAEENVGSTIELTFGNQSLRSTITVPHDPPLIGVEEDLVPRMESYVKDFTKMRMGNIQIDQGLGTLELKAVEIPGQQVMDFSLLVFKKL